MIENDAFKLLLMHFCAARRRSAHGTFTLDWLCLHRSRISRTSLRRRAFELGGKRCNRHGA